MKLNKIAHVAAIGLGVEEGIWRCTSLSTAANSPEGGLISAANRLSVLMGGGNSIIVMSFAAKVRNPFQFYKNWKGFHCFYSEIDYFLLFSYLILSNFCKFGKKWKE